MNANQEIIAELRRVLEERDQARRERDDALARIDSQRSQIAFYRTACTARFLPKGFGDETMRELINDLMEDRDDARSTIEDLNDEIARGREAIRIYRTETEAAERERDEWRDKFHALNQTAGEICNACGWAFKIPGESCRCEVVKERDEARAERDAAIARITEVGVMVATNGNLLAKDAYRRGAEAMREACARMEPYAYNLDDHLMISKWRSLVRGLPIPEEP